MTGSNTDILTITICIFIITVFEIVTVTYTKILILTYSSLSE